MKIDLTRWTPAGEPLVEIARENGSCKRVVRESEVADFETEGFEVVRRLADEPFDFTAQEEYENVSTPEAAVDEAAADPTPARFAKSSEEDDEE